MCQTNEIYRYVTIIITKNTRIKRKCLPSLEHVLHAK